ncbi:MAG: DUF4845 domain-containing protein [Candidatus Tectimicrobiota bacterium]
MHWAQHQRGVTLIGLLIILAPFVLLGYVLMCAAPAYIEAYSVGDALNSLKKEFDLKEKPTGEIYNLLRKRFEVNDIRSIQKEDVKIHKTPNDVSVSVDYETKVPLFGNVALALSFSKKAVIR